MTVLSRRAACLAVAVVTAGALAGCSGGASPTAAQAAAVISQEAGATAPLTVDQAIALQNGSSETVHGYVVGQPTAANTVLTSGFTGDTALALASSPGETNTAAMLYVQLSGSYRSSFGLAANPALVGAQLDVTGTLVAYFAHPGVKSPTAMALSGSTPTGTATSIPTGIPTTSATGTAGPTPGPSSTSPVDIAAYYAPAAGKTGNDLHKALHQIISTGVSKLSYDDVWDALKVTDQDPKNSGNVILLYSGTSRSKSLSGGDPDDWNREHVWAKSHGDFGTATGPGTDLHHLRPEDVTVNADRSNKDFDDGGSQSAEAPGNFTDNDSWEPRDAVKGDVARMIFYMAVRYDGGDGFQDLEIDDTTAGGTAPRFGKLSSLLEWSAEDPPDSFEKHRNDVIYRQFQHNRNPFIDHPEWVQEVFG